MLKRKRHSAARASDDSRPRSITSSAGAPHRTFSRQREPQLAEAEIREKLKWLEKHKIPPPIRRDASTQFDWLLDVCLSIERGLVDIGEASWPPKLTNAQRREKDEEKRSEEAGDYDMQSLWLSPIAHAKLHNAYSGPIETSELKNAKLRGVVTTREVLKGELLCTSVPDIVAPCYVGVHEPTAQVFSDLSRAELTAKLIIACELDDTVRRSLDAFKLSGTRDRGTDLRSTCTGLITTCTWAFDHPAEDAAADEDSDDTSIRPTRRSRMGTKVLGHGFSTTGFASQFNHSCLPNATMVNHGPVQFFYANTRIAKGVEVTVSYGYDPLVSVEERRAGLREHGDFTCTCALCEWQASTKNKLFLKQRIKLLELRQSLVHSATSEPADCAKVLAMYEAIDRHGLFEQDHEAEEVLYEVLRGEFTLDATRAPRPREALRWLQFDQVIPTLLERLPLDEADDEVQLKLQRRHILQMLLAMESPGMTRVGVPFGDLVRTNIQKYIDKLVVVPTRPRRLNGRVLESLQPSAATWWEERAAEFTAQF